MAWQGAGRSRTRCPYTLRPLLCAFRTRQRNPLQIRLALSRAMVTITIGNA